MTHDEAIRHLNDLAKGYDSHASGMTRKEWIDFRLALEGSDRTKKPIEATPEDLKAAEDDRVAEVARIRAEAIEAARSEIKAKAQARKDDEAAKAREAEEQAVAQLAKEIETTRAAEAAKYDKLVKGGGGIKSDKPEPVKSEPAKGK